MKILCSKTLWWTTSNVTWISRYLSTLLIVTWLAKKLKKNLKNNCLCMRKYHQIYLNLVGEEKQWVCYKLCALYIFFSLKSILNFMHFLVPLLDITTVSINQNMRTGVYHITFEVNHLNGFQKNHWRNECIFSLILKVFYNEILFCISHYNLHQIQLSLKFREEGVVKCVTHF